MHTYESFGFFDFEDFVDELTEEQLFAVNGGGCGGGYSGNGYGGYSGGNCAGGSPSINNSTKTSAAVCGGGRQQDTSWSITNFIKKTIASFSIDKSINKNKDYTYGTKYNGKDSFCCDNWVEKVLDDAGYDAEYYLTAGDSTNKVAEHIEALKNSGNPYTVTVPKEAGVYVVFMDGDYTMKSGEKAGQTITAQPHCGLLTVDNSGNMFFSDNSSSNSNNGVSTQKVTAGDLNTTLVGLTYSNFYFQEVK